MSKPVADKKAEMTALIERVEEFTSELEENDRLVEKVQYFSIHYSERNAILIVMQRPSATDTRGYREWQSLGRQVKKGQKGIRILAPAGQARKNVTEANPEGEKGRQFFRLISVFDIKQTEPIESE